MFGRPVGRPGIVIRLSLLVVVCMAGALAASACMWGVARDADTGQPIVGAKVTLTDKQGQTLVATTDDRGIFGFGPPTGAAPSLGEAEVKVDAPGYGSVDELRDIAYNDNPLASFADPSSFWEVQAFRLRKGTDAFFHTDDGHFSMAFPAGWKVAPVPDAPVVFTVAPATGSDAGAECELFWAPLNGQSPHVILDGFLDELSNDKTISNIQRFGTTDTIVNGMPASNTVVSFKQDFNNGTQEVQITSKSLLYIISVKDNGYLIACSTLIEKYQNEVPTFEKIVKSFTPDK